MDRYCDFMIVTFKNENMKLFTPEEIIKRYIECCIKMETATLDGDYKTNNYEGKKLNKIYNQILSQPNLAQLTLPTLLYYDNIIVRTYAAAHCIELQMLVKESKKVLKKIAKDKNNGILGFNAEMTLQVYKEEGKL
ncbi:MAG: DUF2019 domain-containing protein [Clostridia bacterium]